MAKHRTWIQIAEDEGSGTPGPSFLQGRKTSELFIPIGFACGLLDRDTRLVRFGYRDYDPSVGRFTCPDPLGDTGGDHDVYEYCVDDPVNNTDQQGLQKRTLWGDIKNGFQNALEWYSPLVFMSESPTKARIRKGYNLAIEENVRGMADGLKGWLRVQDMMTPSFGLPGASKEDWDRADRIQQKGKDDFQRRKKEFLESQNP